MWTNNYSSSSLFFIRTMSLPRRLIDRQSYAIDWTDDVEEDDDVERGDDVDDETMINFFAVGLRAKRRTDTQKCYEKKG